MPLDNRDTHIALCRLLSQKKQNLPSTQDQKELQRCELAATLCMCIWGANTGQRDELRHDADLSNVHRQTEKNPGSERNCQRTPWCDAGTTAQTIGKVKRVCGVHAREQRSSLQLWMKAESESAVIVYNVHTRCVNASCVASEWQVEHDLWPTGLCVWRCARSYSQQTTDRALN